MKEAECSYVMTEGRDGGEGTVDVPPQHRQRSDITDAAFRWKRNTIVAMTSALDK